ncbi:MAG: PadR family transcriptional regulator [Alphaproteobacteria bacterium]|nr:PadR family transcriptional regulator [Alphaproteobacteria bacterium]
MNVRTLCLAVLSLGDATGYEIKKRLEGPLHYIHEASFGSIYPALTRLTTEGLVTCTELNQTKRPDKKVYALTQAGKVALLDELTAEIPETDRVRSDFLVMMHFAHLLPPAFVEQVIEKRLEVYRALLGDLDREALWPARERSPATQFVCGYGRAVIAASLKYIEENRHLVEAAALMTSEQTTTSQPTATAAE